MKTLVKYDLRVDLYRAEGVLALVRALQDILQRKWFKRIWVVQEPALAAGDPLFICGRSSIP